MTKRLIFTAPSGGHVRRTSLNEEAWKPAPASAGVIPDRYLTPEDLAAMLVLPIETVYRWRKQRIGPPGFRVGRHVRYDPAAVRDWIDQQTARDTA